MSLVMLLVFAFAAACGEDETATPTTAPATPTATATATATATGTATATTTATDTATATATGSTDDLINQFPEEVRGLLADVPAPLLQALWEIRQQGPDTIIVADFGGETHAVKRSTFIEEWEQITGWTSQSAPFTGVEPPDFEVKMEAGTPEWDVIEAASDRVEFFSPKGFYEEIDYSIFPTELWPDSVFQGKDWVGQYNGSTNGVYNTEAFPDPATAPQSISDIFDAEKFPGVKRCIWGWPLEYQMEFALIADGVAPEEVFQIMTTKEGRDRAFAKLDTIREDIVYIETGAESVQFIIDGQCDMGLTWNGRPAARLKAEPDLPLKAIHDGAFAWTSPWVFPKGAKNARAGMTMVAYSMLPRNSCENLNTNGYGILMDSPPFPDCLEDFAKENSAQPDVAALFFGPEEVKLRVQVTEEITEEWNAWKTGG
jgi:putative spermidine/putrescine transport system substrate-binding protein